MTGWEWVLPLTAEALHDRQLAEHGGPAGVRDRGAFESAIARPQNLAVYGSPSAAELAAAYAYGIARNHPFVDGNKRTAWVVARLFLVLNGVALRYDKDEAVAIMLDLAARKVAERELANWFEARIVQPLT